MPPPSIEPYGARVLVRAHQPESKSEIALTDYQPITSGIVVAKGPACRDDDLRVGDFIGFTAFVGDELTLNDQPHVMVEERDVLCVVGPRGA